MVIKIQSIFNYCRRNNIISNMIELIISKCKRKKQFSLWDALRTPWRVQTLYGLSPFILNRKTNQLSPTWYTTAYSYLILVLHFVILSLSLWLMAIEGLLKFDSGNSYLWNAICCFEVVFVNVAYPLLIFFTERKKYKQILFFNKIYKIDKLLQDQFSINDIMYRKLYQFNNISVFTIIFYYDGLFLCVLWILIKLDVHLRSYGIFLFALAYHIEQVSNGLMTWFYVNCVKIVKQRFEIISNVQGTIVQSMKSNQQYKTSRDISLLLALYRELCETINILNENSGLMLTIRLAHDFTLLTSQCFLIFWIALNDRDDSAPLVILAVIVWMMQNFVKIGAISVLSGITSTEVDKTRIMKFKNKNDFLFFKFRPNHAAIY